MYGLRKDLFYRKNLSEERALQEGYGFYDTPVSLGCVTENNLCAEEGIETTVTKCIPNPRTFNGCFNEENGTMTYNNIVTSKPCTKQCVKYAFSVQEGILYGSEEQATSAPATVPPTESKNTVKKVYNQGCNRVIDSYYGIDYTDTYFGDYNTDTEKYAMKTVPNSDPTYPICIPSNLTGFVQKKYVCANNDQSGLKLCQYMCGTEKTLNVSGKFESNTKSSNVLMHYPYYDQGDGERFYFCYDKLGDNLLEGLYNTETVGPDFIFPKQCYTRYIQNYNKYGITTNEISYLSDYIVFPSISLISESTTFDISQNTAIDLPSTYTQKGPILEFQIAIVGTNYKLGDKLTITGGDAYLIIDGGVGTNGELSQDIGYYTFYGGASNSAYSVSDKSLTGGTGSGATINITKTDDNGSVMLAKVGVEFMKVVSFKQNQTTIADLDNNYYLYSKNPITGLTVSVLSGVASGDYVYVYQLSLGADYNPKSPSPGTYGFYDGNCNVLKIDANGNPSPKTSKIGSYNSDEYYEFSTTLGTPLTTDLFITKSLIIKKNLSTLRDISNISYIGEYNTEFSFVMSTLLTETSASVLMPYSVNMLFSGNITGLATPTTIKLNKAPFNEDFEIRVNNSNQNQIVIQVDRDFLQSNNVRVPHKKGQNVYFIHNFAEKLADFTELMSPYILNSDGSVVNGCFDEYNKPRPHGYTLKLEPGQTVVANVESNEFNLDTTPYKVDSPVCGVYGYMDDTSNTPKPPFQNRKGYSEVNIIENYNECTFEEDGDDDISNMFRLGISNNTSENQLSCFSSYEKGATNRICEIPKDVSKYDDDKTYYEGDIVYQEFNDTQFYLSVSDNNTFEITDSTKWKEVSFFNSIIQNMEKGEYFINKKPNVLKAIGDSTNTYSWDIYNVQNSGLRTIDPSNYFTPFINENIYFPPKLVDIKLELSSLVGSTKYYPFDSQTPTITKPFYMDLLVNKLIYAPTDINVDDQSIKFSENSTWRKYAYGDTNNFDFIDPNVTYISNNKYHDIPTSTSSSVNKWQYGLRFDTRPDIMYNNSGYTVSGAVDHTERQIDLMGMRSTNADLGEKNTTHAIEYQKTYGDSVKLNSVNTSITDAYKPDWTDSNANKAYGSKFGVYNDGNFNPSGTISKANYLNWKQNQDSIYHLAGTSPTGFNGDLVSTFTDTGIQYNIGAKELSQRWYQNFTNNVRIFFWPLYLPEDISETSYTPNSKRSLNNITNSVSSLIDSAKDGNYGTFNIPTTYNKYFNLGSSLNSDVVLSDFSYKLPIADTTTTNIYKHKTTFDIFANHKYTVSSDWWKSLPIDIKTWLDANYKVNGGDLYKIVPLFASISIRDDIDNMASKDSTNVTKKYHSLEYNNENNTMKSTPYSPDSAKNIVNSVETFDYFEAFNSIYAKDLQIDSKTPDQMRQLWSSYSVNQGEFVIGRIDDTVTDSYRLIMLQKNEDFADLELYFNYPRAPAVFSLPEIEPLAVGPRQYSKIYCYVNNIESIIKDKDGTGYDVGYIQKGKGVMWDDKIFNGSIVTNLESISGFKNGDNVTVILTSDTTNLTTTGTFNGSIVTNLESISGFKNGDNVTVINNISSTTGILNIENRNALKNILPSSFNLTKEYWNEQYLPFNQSTMQTGYGRLAKSIPGKLAYDGWGVRTNNTTSTKSPAGEYVVNIFLHNLYHNNKLMPIYCDNSGTPYKQVWYTTDTITRDSTSTANDLNNIVATSELSDWKLIHNDSLPYKKLFDLPAPNDPISTTSTANEKWQTLLDNIWTPPGVIYQQDCSFIEIPSGLRSTDTELKDLTQSTLDDKFNPSTDIVSTDGSGISTINYTDIPYYWLNNIRDFYGQSLTDGNTSSNIDGLLFYNDFIRATFWGNPSSDRNTFNQLYSGETLFTSDQYQPAVPPPLQIGSNPASSETITYQLSDGGYQQFGNSYLPSLQDYINLSVKQKATFYDPTKMFQNQFIQNTETGISVSGTYPPYQEPKSELDSDNFFPIMEDLIKNYKNELDGIDSYFPIPLISSYSDINYLNPSITNTLTDHADFSANTYLTNVVEPATIASDTIGQYSSVVHYTNSLANYLYQVNCTLMNTSAAAANTDPPTPTDPKTGTFNGFQMNVGPGNNYFQGLDTYKPYGYNDPNVSNVILGNTVGLTGGFVMSSYISKVAKNQKVAQSLIEPSGSFLTTDVYHKPSQVGATTSHTYPRVWLSLLHAGIQLEETWYYPGAQLKNFTFNPRNIYDPSNGNFISMQNTVQELYPSGNDGSGVFPFMQNNPPIYITPSAPALVESIFDFTAQGYFWQPYNIDLINNKYVDNTTNSNFYKKNDPNFIGVTTIYPPPPPPSAPQGTPRSPPPPSEFYALANNTPSNNTIFSRSWAPAGLIANISGNNSGSTTYPNYPGTLNTQYDYFLSGSTYGGSAAYGHFLYQAHLLGLFHTLHSPYGIPLNLQTQLTPKANSSLSLKTPWEIASTQPLYPCNMMAGVYGYYNSHTTDFVTNALPNQTLLNRIPKPVRVMLDLKGYPKIGDSDATLTAPSITLPQMNKFFDNLTQYGNAPTYANLQTLTGVSSTGSNSYTNNGYGIYESMITCVSDDVGEVGKPNRVWKKDENNVNNVNIISTDINYSNSLIQTNTPTNYFPAGWGWPTINDCYNLHDDAAAPLSLPPIAFPILQNGAQRIVDSFTNSFTNGLNAVLPHNNNLRAWLADLEGVSKAHATGNPYYTSVSYTVSDTNYTNYLIKNDSGHFGTPLFLGNTTYKKYGDYSTPSSNAPSITSTEQYLKYAFDILEGNTTTPKLSEPEPVYFDNQSLKNKTLLVPIKEFYQVQSPYWNMRATNYLPTDGAAVTLKGPMVAVDSKSDPLVPKKPRVFPADFSPTEPDGFKNIPQYVFTKGVIGQASNNKGDSTRIVNTQRLDSQQDWRGQTETDGMICSQGSAEKYTYTVLEKRGSFKLINYNDTSDTVNKYITTYKKQSVPPKYLPFVYDTLFIDKMNTDYDLTHLSDNYNEMFKMLQLEAIGDSIFNPKPKTVYNQLSQYYTNKELTFPSDNTVLNFYDTTPSKDAAKAFLYEPILDSRSQNPFTWKTTEVAVPVEYGLVKTGYNNTQPDNTNLFGNIIDPQEKCTTKTVSWYSGTSKPVGEAFKGRKHTKFVAIYPHKEDIGSQIKKVFGSSDSPTQTKTYLGTKTNSTISYRETSLISDLSVTGNISVSDLDANYKFSNENHYILPFYSYSSTAGSVKTGTPTKDITSVKPQTTIPVMHKTPGDSYQFYNLVAKTYESNNLASTVVSDFNDRVYNSTNYSLSVTTTEPSTPDMNYYANFSNFTGRTYIRYSTTQAKRTAYVKPDYTFKLPTVDLKSNYVNNAIRNNSPINGLATFLYNYGYGQQNPGLTWPSVADVTTIKSDDGTGFVPTESSIFNDIYGSNPDTFGAGKDDGQWLKGKKFDGSKDTLGTLNYYYRDLYDEKDKLPQNLGIVNSSSTTNRYLYQKYDEQLTLSQFTPTSPNTPSNTPLADILNDPNGNNMSLSSYFSTDLNSNTDISLPITQEKITTPKGETYKVIAVTDLLDKEIPYLFEGTKSATVDDASGANPIWHRLDVSGETMKFETLLFYECPTINNSNKNYSVMGKSNFFIDEANSDTQIRAKVDVTDAWSSVNDLTPYKQPGQMYDQFLPAYGCLPMSGGRMVWNELNYDSNGNRIADNIYIGNHHGDYVEFQSSDTSNFSDIDIPNGESVTVIDINDSTQTATGTIDYSNQRIINLTGGFDAMTKVYVYKSIPQRVSNYLNKNIITGTSGTYKDYKATHYTMTSDFGASSPRILNEENSSYFTITNTSTKLSLKTITFTNDSTDNTSMNIDLAITGSQTPGSKSPSLKITDGTYNKSSPESKNGIVTYRGLNVPIQSSTKNAVITVTDSTGALTITIKNETNKSVFSNINQPITLLGNETVYAVLPMMEGFNKNVLKNLSITGYFPELSSNEGYGLYVNQKFFNQFLNQILPGEGTYLSTIFDPFNVSIGNSTFSKSNDFVINIDGTGTFQFKFSDANTPNNVTKTNTSGSSSLSRDEFYVNTPSSFNAALGFNSETTKIRDNEVSFMKIQTLNTPKGLINGIYILPISTQTVFTKIGGIRYFFYQEYDLDSSTISTGYQGGMTYTQITTNTNTFKIPDITDQKTITTASQAGDITKRIPTNLFLKTTNNGTGYKISTESVSLTTSSSVTDVPKIKIISILVFKIIVTNVGGSGNILNYNIIGDAGNTGYTQYDVIKIVGGDDTASLTVKTTGSLTTNTSDYTLIGGKGFTRGQTLDCIHNDSNGTGRIYKYQVTDYGSGYNKNVIFTVPNGTTNNATLESQYSVDKLMDVTSVIDLRQIFNLPETASGDYAKSINIALNDIKNFILNLREGDIIGLEQEFIDQIDPYRTHPIYTFRIMSTNPSEYKITVDTTVVSESGNHQALRLSKIPIESPYTYLYLYSTRLATNEISRKDITVGRMAFIEGKVKYNDNAITDHTDYTVITPAYLKTFDITQGTSLIDKPGQTLYNENFNLTFYTSLEKPAILFDVFGNYTSNAEGSTIASRYELNSPYNVYQIVYVNGKENVFFKALKQIKPSNTKPPVKDTGNTFTYNSTDWKFIDLDENPIVESKKWEPYRIYNTNDVVYTEKNILPYISDNEGETLSDLSKLKYILPSTYPYKLYENDSLNLKYYQSNRNFNIGDNDPRFQIYYKDVDVLSNYQNGNVNINNQSNISLAKTDAQNLGYMCKAGNNISLTYKEWKSNPYQGCNRPFEIYSFVPPNPELTFDAVGIIKNAFVEQLSIDNDQNWSSSELKPFFNDDKPFDSNITTVIISGTTYIITYLSDPNKVFIQDNSGNFYGIIQGIFTTVSRQFQTFVKNTVEDNKFYFTYYPDPDGTATELYYIYNGTTLTQRDSSDNINTLNVDITVDTSGDISFASTSKPNDSSFTAGSATLTQGINTINVDITVDTSGDISFASTSAPNDSSFTTSAPNTGTIGTFSKSNQTISENRVVACCQKNKVFWDDYTLPNNLSGGNNNFAFDSQDMLKNFKANTGNNAFITQSNGINNFVTVDTTVNLYFSDTTTTTIPTGVVDYKNIKSAVYYIEIFESLKNVYYTIQLTSSGNYTIPKTFEDQYPGITFFIDSTSSPTSSKPSSTTATAFDTVYYSKISYDSKYPYYLFKGDSREGTQFSTTSSCIYFNKNPSPDGYSLSNLLGSYLIAKYIPDSVNDPYFLLTLQNSPCELGNTTDWCSDCNAQSDSGIASQAVSFLPVINNGTAGKPDKGQMNKPLCTNDSLTTSVDPFDLSNALLLYFVPLPVEYQPTDTTVLHTRIMTYFGSQFMGWLKFNRSIEINKDHEIRELDVGVNPILSSTPAFVSYSNFDILDTEKETTVLIGNQYIQTKEKGDITENKIYYTNNFKDEDVFKVTYDGTNSYDIQKLDESDIYFVVDITITDDISPSYKPGPNADYLLAGSYFDLSYFDLSSYTGTIPEDKETVLVNMNSNTVQNGVYLYSATDTTLTRHEDFNTYEKLRQNKQVKVKSGDKHYFDLNSLVKNEVDKAIQPVPILTPTSPYITTTNVNYYTDIPSSSSLPYILVDNTNSSKTGYYSSVSQQSPEQPTSEIFKSKNGEYENMYWSINRQIVGDTTYYSVQNITNLYNQVSGLTNRTNKLEINKLAGVEQFTKDKTFAKGMPLTNLQLTPVFEPSSLSSSEEVTTFSELRENRKPLQLMSNINNDCSLFFSFDPFLDTTVLRSYNLVELNGTPKLQPVEGVAGQIFNPSNIYNPDAGVINTKLLFGFKYQINQYEENTDKSPVITVTSGNSSILVSYIIEDSQLGKTDALSVSGTTSSSSIAYQNKLPSQAQIIIEPRASNSNPSTPPTVIFTVSYNNNIIETFTVS